MQYVIQVDEERKLVTAIAKGEWDSEAEKFMVNQIMETVDTRKMQKVLLDVRELHFKISILQVFERAKEIRTQRQKFNNTSAKAAIIYSADDTKLEEEMIFFENAARNRNLPYQVFKDVDIALKWLLSS